MIKLTVPHFVYMAASDGEEAFWAQLLMVVMLAAGGGIYAFIKTRPGHRRGGRGPVSIHRNIFNRGIDGVLRLIQTAGRQISLKRPAAQHLTAGQKTEDRGLRTEDSDSSSVVRHPSSVISAVSAVKLSHVGAKRRDLKSGMELLAGSFLVKVIEFRSAEILADGLDIEMQKMCFAEMKRRNELEAVSSEALKTYTVDEAGHFGKTIQRQAMEELTCRTEQKG